MLVTSCSSISSIQGKYRNRDVKSFQDTNTWKTYNFQSQFGILFWDLGCLGYSFGDVWDIGLGIWVIWNVIPESSLYKTPNSM